MNVDTLETLRNARSRLLHTNPQPPPAPNKSPKQRPASATRAVHSAGSSPENTGRQRPQSAKERVGNGSLPDDVSNELGTDMAWQRVSHWLKVLAHSEGMDQTSFLRSTTSSFLATSYPGIAHSRSSVFVASPPKIVQRQSQQQQQIKESTLELQALQARKITKLELENANLKDAIEKLRGKEEGSSPARDGSMRVVFDEQLAKSKRTCEALMRDKAQLMKELDTAQELCHTLSAAVEGHKVQIAQLHRKLELKSQQVLDSPVGKAQTAVDARIAEAFDANAHLLQQVKQLQTRLDDQQKQLQLEAKQRETIQQDAAAKVAAAERHRESLGLQNAQLQLQLQQLQNSSISSLATAPPDAPLAVLNSELVQLVEQRGAAIAALQAEMSASVDAALGAKAADIISKERRRIEPHVTSLVQAVRSSEGRSQLLQDQLKQAQDQLLQLQHSVMVTNLTQSQRTDRPSSATSRGSSAPVSESEAAARLIKAQMDSLKMQVSELEAELRQVRQDLMASGTAAETLTVQLDGAKREAADSKALALSLKALAKGGADAVSSATEHAALNQQLARAQDTIKGLMDQEAARVQAISSLEHDLEAKLDQIDELKGQIMTSLLKNRELALEVEATQNELQDKEQELRSLQNYVVSLEAGEGGEGGGGSSYMMAEAERLRSEVDYSNERRNESEFKAEAAQQRVEELEPELNSMREAYEQSQKALHALRGAQEEMMEQRCQELQAQLEEVMLELESWKGDLAASEEECAFALNNMALMLKKSNRIAEALPLYTRALELRQKALGENHVELSPIMVNIGALHFMAGNYADASTFFVQALQIREQELGVDHSQTISTQQWVTKCQSKLEEGAAAQDGE